MKKLILLFISIFVVSNLAHSVEHKRVSINKVIEAIEDDAEKALKEYALFSARFGVEPNADSHDGHLGVVKGEKLSYSASGSVKYLEANKKYKFSCKLEKYKDAKGAEKVRIRITEILK